MAGHGHSICPHCDHELAGKEPACPSCDGALFGIPPKSSTIREKVTEVAQKVEPVVKDAVATVEEKSTQAVEKMNEVIGEHVVPIFNTVGESSSKTVEAVKEKFSTTSSEENEDMTSQTPEDDPWADIDQPATVAPAGSDAPTLVSEGEELGRIGRERDALGKFNQAIAIDPSNAMAWFNRGVIHEILGEVDEAISSFKICLDMDSEHGPAAANLAVLLHRRGRSDEASRVAEIGLNSFPNHPTLTEILAGGDPTKGAPIVSPEPVVLEQSSAVHEPAEVIAEPTDVEEVVQVAAPQPVPAPAPAPAATIDLDALAQQAAESIKQGNPEGSLELLRDVLHTHAADHSRCWRIAAAAMARMDLVESAIEAFTYALEIDNEDAPSWFNLGALHRKNGHEETAITCFETALSLRPEYTKASSVLIEIHTGKGNLEGAISAWRNLLAAEPNNPQRTTYAKMLIEIAEGEGEVLEMVTELPTTLPEGPALASEALNYIPLDGEAGNIRLRARALSLTGEHAESVKAWRSLIEVDKENADLWTGMMRAFIAAGDTVTAEKCRAKIASLNGEQASVQDANTTLEPVTQIQTEPAPEPEPASVPEPAPASVPEPEPAPVPEPELEIAEPIELADRPISDDPWGDTWGDEAEEEEIASEPSYDVEEVNAAETALSGYIASETVEAEERVDSAEVNLAKVALDAQAASAAAADSIPARIESTAVANLDIEWYNKGLGLIGDEKYEEALSCFDKALPSFVDDDEMVIRILNGRGNALYYLNRYAECIESYHKAMAIDPAGVTGATLYNMGTAYAEVERFNDAVKCFEQGMSKKRNAPLTGNEAKMAKEQVRRCKILQKEQDKKLSRLAKMKSS